MTRLLSGMIAALMILVLAGTATADDVDVTFEGRFGGAVYACAVSGNYAYMGQGQDLVLLGVSSPASPVELERVMTSDIVGDVAVSGDYAYVADGSNGFGILRTDATSADTAPNTPTHTPTITIAGTASDTSGIASVTVNCEPANETLDWSANVTLVKGENTIPVVATDDAGPTTTKTVTVYRIEPFTFVHITDVHLGFTFLDIEMDDRTETFTESIEKFTDTLQAVKTHNPEFILSPGDLVEYSNNDFFDAYMGILESLDILDIPVYNTPGNHDRRGWDPRDNVGLTTYDEIITNPGDIKPLNDGYRDYYFDKHGYRFIGLDSGADYNVSLPPFLISSNVSTLASYDDFYDSSPEGDGLKEIQLTGLSEMDSEMPKIIFMHHPAVSDSDDESTTWSFEPPVTNNCPPEYGGNDACIAFNRCGFIDYCINNNTDLVLTGHTHWDYVKTVYNEPETHKTRFIQTRSATKDPDPCNYHGYRVIKITDEETVAHKSEMTEDILRSIERYTYSTPSNLPDHTQIYAYMISGSNITGILPDDTIRREIPDSYYTGVLDELPQVIKCYNEKPDKFKFGVKSLPADASDNTSQRAIEEASINFNIIMKHQTENMTVKYIYEAITFGTSENATAIVDLGPANVNYTMEIDYDGDGIIDDTTDPTHIIINHAPEISITTPTGEESGNVTIPYNLKDAESDDCTIIAQYSLNNISWFDADVGEGGDGMIDVASTPAGVDHTFVWASGIDIPYMNATVYFRIGPYDGGMAGDYVTTAAFSVDNRVRGDLNRDGDITPADAAIALQLAASGAQNPAADVNDDGRIAPLDALMILQAATANTEL